MNCNLSYEDSQKIVNKIESVIGRLNIIRLNECLTEAPLAVSVDLDEAIIILREAQKLLPEKPAEPPYMWTGVHA